MAPLAVVFLLALAAAAFGVTQRARAYLVDTATSGRHAAHAGRPTQHHGPRAGWDTGALPIVVRSIR